MFVFKLFYETAKLKYVFLNTLLIVKYTSFNYVKLQKKKFVMASRLPDPLGLNVRRNFFSHKVQRKLFFL